MNIDPNAYMRTPSVPKSPLDPGTAAFVKGKPAITQPAIVQIARDWRYYENAIIQHEKVGADLYLEYRECGAWKAHYKTWEDACVPLGKSRRQIDRLIKEEREIQNRPSCPNTDSARTLAKVNDLPDPLAEFNPMAAFESGQPESVQVIPPAAPVPAPKAVPERTRATPTESGKPKSKLAVWVEIEHGYGHLLPRIDELNKICPNASMHRDLLNQTKSCMESLAEWKAMVK